MKNKLCHLLCLFSGLLLLFVNDFLAAMGGKRTYQIRSMMKFATEMSLVMNTLQHCRRRLTLVMGLQYLRSAWLWGREFPFSMFG